MAIIPGTIYSSQTDVDAVNFPQGKARNVSVTGDGTGTPLSKEWVNDLWGFQQALLAAAAITPSGSPDTAVTSQYLQALHAIFPNHITQFANTPESNPVNQTVTATGPTTPTALTHSAFATANPLALNDVIDISYGPIDFTNLNASGNNAFLCLQVSQNGGAFTTIRSYMLIVNRAYPLTIRAQFKCTTAGGFIAQLAVLNDNAGSGVACRSLEDGTLTLFDYFVMRP